MLTRRTLLLISAASVLAPRVLAPGFAFAADGPQATKFIQKVADELVEVVNGDAPITDKKRRLKTIIDANVDVDAVAQFCLGRFWRQASAEQQKQYVGLFHDVLVTNITGKIGDYRGVKFTINGVKSREDSEIVASTVERPNNPPSEVDWVVTTAGGAPKIADVIAEGTSLRLTQRSDYAAYLTRNQNSVDALIAAMKQQLSQQGS
jgi:phospholipid transport system substrate-binding protein